ncbi:MAG: ADOP family duplicated permease, partial [Terracidiphilus sp.]
DGVWLRPLQISDPAHLVAIQSLKAKADADSERDSGSSYAEFRDVRERAQAFSDVIAVSGRGVVVDRGDGLKLLLARVVSENYFEVLGARAALGRLPSQDEMLHAETPVMVLGYGAWKSVFAGDPAVVGSTVKLSHGVGHIMGVLAPGFRGTDRMLDPQVYVSQAGWVTWDPDERNTPRTIREFDLYARLRPGATLEQARGQLETAAAQLGTSYPQSNAGRTFTAQWEPEAGDPRIKTLSLLLLAVAGAVLLIACTNILNLMLALNDGRRREIAMRVALGASRAQMLRQLLTEYCVLAAAGIGGAILLAQRIIVLVPALMPDTGYPVGFDFRIDWRAMAFTAAAGLVSVLFCGLAAGLASSRVSALEATRTRFMPTGRLKMPARKIFVVAQLAMSMGLLMATGLLVRTLIHIESMDMGFNQAQNAVLLDVAVSQDGPRRAAEFQALADRLGSLPGVQDASVARVVPFPDNGGGASKVVLAPEEVATATAGTAVWFNLVDDAYFRTVGVPLMRGRTFDRQDQSGSARVAIVNQTLAKKLFGSDDVVGRHFRVGREEPVDTEVVGVAQDGKYGDVTESPQPYLYLPLDQNGWSEVMVIGTTSGNPDALLPAARRAVREVDPNILVMSAQTLSDHIRLHTYMNRIAAWLTASLGGLALLLTAVGLYGVTAYSVSRRTQEIGIRMALGARRTTVFSAVLREGLRLDLIGLALGAALAFLIGRAMSGVLYGVTEFDPIAFAGSVGLVVVVSVAALAAPARRAMRLDPADALREE